VIEQSSRGYWHISSKVMVLYISGWRETRYPQVNNYVELKAKNLAPTAAGTRSLHILDKSTFCRAFLA
jgi:hypothetical protein